MKKVAFCLLLNIGVIGGLGCARTPFEEVVFEPLLEVDSEKVRLKFAESLPSQFEISESMTLSSRGQSFVAIAHSEINGRSGMIKMAGFTPAGVKLAEIESSGEDTDFAFELSDLQSKFDSEKLARAIVRDMRRVYLERVPSPDSITRVENDRIIFEEIGDAGVLEYVFGGPHEALVEKRYKEQGKIKWQVTYHTYHLIENELFAENIYFENKDEHYQIALRLREIY